MDKLKKLLYSLNYYKNFYIKILIFERGLKLTKIFIEFSSLQEA